MQQKPFPGTPINMAHPWTRNLVAAYLFSEESGTGTADSLHGVNLTTYNGSWSFAQRQWTASSYSAGTSQTNVDNRGVQGVGGGGKGLRCYGNGSDTFTGLDRYLPAGGHAFSFLAHIVTAAAPDGGANRVGTIFSYGTAGNDGVHGLRLLSSTQVSFFGYLDDLTGTVTAMLSHQSLWVGGSFDGTTARLYYSVSPGRMTEITNGNKSSWSVVKSGTLTVCKSLWTNEFWDGWIDYLYFWDIPQPLDLMNQITLAPFDMFTPASPNWTRYNIASFGGTVANPFVIVVP